MAEAKPTLKKRDFKKIFTYAFMVLNLSCLSVGAFFVYSATLAVNLKSATDAQLSQELDQFIK